MDPTCYCVAIVLVKLQQIELEGRSQSTTIILKMLLKLGETKWWINILGAKMILWVDHLWTRLLWVKNLWSWLLLVWTLPTEQCHQVIQFQSEQNHQSLCHWHYQWIHQLYQQISNRKMENRTKQGTLIQTHHCQTHHQRNINCQMTSIQINQGKRNALRRKSTKKTWKMTHRTRCRSKILIRLTILITDANDARRGAIREKYPIKLCARLTAELLTTKYKLKKSSSNWMKKRNKKKKHQKDKKDDFSDPS